ncbi:retrotransposon protein, putative, unclassified [Panicum miliaceum]|uniref:Retrotransposon protein, putative, unclassified n=1 Tax=Panicum miliaceum TaxID=4540 RepID=A0A3L6TPQ5_PANMI|nr:retrotransposon protein, putative, unclassified [Panicum miliaceum]
MGNKKQASKGKKEESTTGDWERISQGLLQSEEMVQWKPSFRQFVPQKDIDHIEKEYLVGGAGLQFKQGKGKEYIEYSLPTNHSGWRSLWFYIGNHPLALSERTPGKAVWRPEWNEKLNPNQLLQVNKLLELISKQKESGVTGVSVMASMYKRRTMPLQKRCRYGFEYLGSNDPSRLSAKILPSQMALDRVRRVLLDANTVPYVPKLFSAGHSELYHCPTPNLDLPRVDQLKPSAFQMVKTSRLDCDPLTDEEMMDSDDDLPLAAYLKKSGKESSSSMELPSHPTKPRVSVRKCKLSIASLSDDNRSPPASPLSKRSKDGGKSGPSGDDAAPVVDVQPGAADPSAVDVASSPSNPIPASALEAQSKEPAGGSGKSGTRGPRLLQLKNVVTKRSSTPSFALDLGEPDNAPAAQAYESGKEADVAVLETGATPRPPPPPPASNVEAEKESEPERVEVQTPAPKLPEGEPILPPPSPSTKPPAARLVNAGEVAGEPPKESGAGDASASGNADPGASTVEAVATSGLGVGDAGATSTSEPSADASEREDLLVTLYV